MSLFQFHHESHQLSDSTPVAVMLALTGGYLDAYTYVCRGGVFANAQTGNMVFFGMKIAAGDYGAALSYLVPILSFAAGVFITEQIKANFKHAQNIHWRQIVLLVESLLLTAVAFIPHAYAMVANCIVSFVCALQVDSFRKWHGNAFSTTMCTGNLRTATELICSASRQKDAKLAVRGWAYYIIIMVFIAGAMAGYALTKTCSYYSVLFAIIPLLGGFLLMFFREK
jgi:uncharacterized membrane protein YoaK (UPF0700 family)